MTYCPCDRCSERRKTCSCEICFAWRESSGANLGEPLAQFLRDNKATAAEAFAVAAREQRRCLGEGDTGDASKRSRQLEMLGRMLLGDQIDNVLLYAPKAKINVANIVGFESDTSTAQSISIPLTAQPSHPRLHPSVVVTSNANAPSHSSAAGQHQPHSPAQKKTKSITRFRPERLLNNPACPACKCKAHPIVERNMERKLLGHYPIRGNAAKCAEDCPRGIWMEQQRAAHDARRS